MKMLAGTLAITLGLLSPCLFAADAAEARAQCAQWAKEDGVDKEELEQYMADCVADQLANADDSSPQD